jgi:hypothetical protein
VLPDHANKTQTFGFCRVSRVSGFRVCRVLEFTGFCKGLSGFSQGFVGFKRFIGFRVLGFGLLFGFFKGTKKKTLIKNPKKRLRIVGVAMSRSSPPICWATTLPWL